MVTDENNDDLEDHRSYEEACAILEEMMRRKKDRIAKEGRYKWLYLREKYAWLKEGF